LISNYFGFIGSIRSIGFIGYTINDVGASEQIKPIKQI